MIVLIVLYISCLPHEVYVGIFGIILTYTTIKKLKKMLLMQLKETKLSLQVAIQILIGGLNDQPVDALLSLQVLHASCYIFCHFDQHLRC